MNRNRIALFLAFTLVLAALVAVSEPVRAILERAPSQGGAPAVVSYQGQVALGGLPFDGTGYFKFAVVNQAGDTTYWSNDGTSTGGGEPAASVEIAVSGGLFNVLLGDTTLANMGALTASAFDGVDRVLRVWFSSEGSTFSQLDPDRRIAAAPYALQAEEAKNAATAGDADTLDGQHASAFQQRYANVVIVAKSGGDYTTITGALNSIADASDANRYLVRVMPGVYSERVTMKQYVDIEGAGELTTRITFTGSASLETGTLVGADNAELRFLTVENTGGNNYAIAIFNNSASPRLTHVTARASGGNSINQGVRNRYSSSLMTSVTANALAGVSGYSVGVSNYYSSPTMTDVTASGTGGGTSNNDGVNNYLSSPIMMDVTASASGGIECRGIYNYDSTLIIHNSAIYASCVNDNYGVRNRESSLMIQNCRIDARGGTINYGIYTYNLSASDTIRVTNSQVRGSTDTIIDHSIYTTQIGATLLDGGEVHSSSEAVTCAGVYDEAFVFYANTCP